MFNWFKKKPKSIAEQRAANNLAIIKSLGLKCSKAHDPCNYCNGKRYYLEWKFREPLISPAGEDVGKITCSSGHVCPRCNYIYIYGVGEKLIHEFMRDLQNIPATTKVLIRNKKFNIEILENNIKNQIEITNKLLNELNQQLIDLKKHHIELKR